jgi:penicillin-binding protein 1A
MSLFDFLSPKSNRRKPSSRTRREPKFTSDGEEEGYEYETEYARKKKRTKAKSQGSLRDWFYGEFVKLSLIAGGIFSLFVLYLYLTLPDISKLAEFKKTPSIIVKSETGSVIGTYGDVYGDYVPYSQFPKSLINAVVATEDRNFFHHHGIDPFGVMRAMVANLRARHLVQGGSTITQQVAKNVFLTPERTLSRKIQEVLLAFELESHYSKMEILTIYLNRVYMGAGNYGVDSASKRYFGHSVRDINLNEAAILVGLLKAPSRYAPTNNPDLSEKRATQVLINMKEAGYLTEKEEKAAAENFGDEDSSYRDNHSFGSFYFSDYIVNLLPQYIGNDAATKEDLVVTTTLNTAWQHMAEDAINHIMDAKGKTFNASQAALVSMTPDGAIKAMVGGRNYRSSQFNRVTQALRQPGSSFKLFVYLAALEAGFIPGSEVIDQPINVGNWHPRNYSGKYEGRITLRMALADSVNSVAVQLSEAVGRERVVEMAQRLGITTKINPDPSVALGTNEVTLFDMTKAYAHLASGGYNVMPYSILRVETSDGHKLYERIPSNSIELLRPPVVNMMNNMLIAVTTLGTGRGAQIGRPIAGKTGTTSDYHDAWFIGFTPNLVTGVWVGNDDTKPMKKVSGSTLPASIWHEYMADALRGVPVAEIPNQSDNGILSNLFTSGTLSQKVTAPSGAQIAPPAATYQPGMAPAPLQPTPQQPHPVQMPQTQPVPVVLQPPAHIPEEEPVPEYNAPPSFWDKLLGDN